MLVVLICLVGLDRQGNGRKAAMKFALLRFFATPAQHTPNDPLCYGSQSNPFRFLIQDQKPALL
jgi:hypothetical protein